jgi:tetratricopeptide (TPR) repeat protein
VRPDFLPPKINIASTLLATGNYRDPLPYILEALSQNPNDATLHEVLGEIYYMMDNMEEALKEWERSLRLEKNDNLQMRLEKARKEMEIARNYQVSNASHFTLIFDGEKYSRLGDDALSFLEENFDELVYRFSHYPPLPFSIIIYPESDFYEITESPKWVGGLFDGKIRIPVGGLESLTPRAKRMLLHELAHAFIHSKTKGNCPKWLHEGIAQIIEGKSVPLNVIADDRFEKWDLSSLNRELDYSASLSLVSYIEQTYSFHSIILILEELGRGKDIEKALEKATGLPGESLIHEWKSSMIAKGTL